MPKQYIDTTHYRHRNNHGVYEFLNTLTGKRYIGSTQFLDERGDVHWATLEHGKHHNVDLQRAFDACGHKHFVFGALEYVDDVWLLRACEQKYIDKHGLENLYNVQNAVGKESKVTKTPIDESLLKTLSARRKRWNGDKDNNSRVFLEKHGPVSMWDCFVRVVQMDLAGKAIIVHGSATKKVHAVCRQWGVEYKNRFKPRKLNKSFWAYEYFMLACSVCRCKYPLEIGSELFKCTSCGHMDAYILNALHSVEKYKLTFADVEV